MGGQHPSDTRAQPLPAATAPVPLSLHVPCSQSIPGITAGAKKALRVKPRKPKDVNAPLESGDVSLFTNRVISVWSQAGRGTEEVGRRQEGGAMARARSSTSRDVPLCSCPAPCFWESRSEGEMLQGGSSSCYYSPGSLAQS